MPNPKKRKPKKEKEKKRSEGTEGMLPSIRDIRRLGKKVKNPDGGVTFPSTDPFTGKRILRTQIGRKGRR
ncbi:hypothetical protein IIC68_01780, partial [archaeon]|nr:hypothetical protein [archaeon]